MKPTKMQKRDSINVLFAILLATIGLTGSTLASAPEVSDNARCLVVGLTVGRSSGPARKSIGEAAVMYFLGRLDGSAPTIDLEKVVVGEMGIMTQADLQTEGQRCGQIMVGRSHAMAGLANALNQLAAERSSSQK